MTDGVILSARRNWNPKSNKSSSGNLPGAGLSVQFRTFCARLARHLPAIGGFAAIAPITKRDRDLGRHKTLIERVLPSADLNHLTIERKVARQEEIGVEGLAKQAKCLEDRALSASVQAGEQGEVAEAELDLLERLEIL